MEEAIIVFIEKNEFMYNKSHINYKNVYLRDQKFNELARQLNIPMDKIKSRWRTLKDTFYKEIKSHAGSGNGVETPKKKWKWLDQLMFLKNVNHTNQRTTGNFPLKHEVEFNLFTTTDEDLTEALISNDSDLSDFQNTISSSSSSSTKKPSKAKADALLDSASKEMSEHIKLAKSAFVQHVKPPKSTVRLFFDCIAQQIENEQMSSEKFRKLQVEILKVVNDTLYIN